MSMPQSIHLNAFSNDLPVTCETEKRIKINKYKKMFFEKFINHSSVD